MGEILVFIIFGLFFAMIGLIMLIKTMADYFKARKNCTTPVVAHCVRLSNGTEYLSEEEKAEMGELPDEESDVVAPVFQITYGGQTIELEPHMYSNICRAKVGDIRNVYINPNDPKQYFDPQTYKEALGIMQIFIFLGFIIFGLAFALIPTYFYFTGQI